MVLALFAVSIKGAFCGAPDWLLKLAKAPLPKYPAEASVVVLCDDVSYTFLDDGRQIMWRRYAIRILNASGRKMAVGLVGFSEKSDHASAVGPWVVRDGKDVRPDEPPKWLDQSAAGDKTVVSEGRVLAVDYSSFVLAGDVFAFEATVKSDPSFPQLYHTWESSLPVVSSACSLVLPDGWSIEAFLSGPEKGRLMVGREGQKWSWTMPERPYRPEEPGAACNADVDAGLMVTVIPPAAAATRMLPAFHTWADLTAWLLPLQNVQCDSAPELEKLAKQLTSGAADDMERIRALGRYVQNLRWLSYSKGLSRGFGYRPRKASEVFAKGWGDCKDKANLLRAMLRSVGIEAFLVQAHSEFGRTIRDEWPSPLQFDHAIIAIKVGDAVKAPAVVDVPHLGRLLFFDPTDPDVYPGDVPDNLQGGKVHVVAEGSNALVILPDLPSESSHVVTRWIHLVLAPDGTVTGDCDIGGPGSAGAFFRAEIRKNTAKDFRAEMTEWLNSFVPGAVISDLSTLDDPGTGECRVKCRFAASHFAQMMPGGLAVVRLNVLSRDSVPVFPAKERNFPVEVPPGVFRDEVVLKMPAGYVVDEIPNPVKIDNKYGHYESSCSAADDTVVMRRVLKLDRMSVPVDEYLVLRKFFADVAKADHASVVLRQGG